MQKTTKNKIIAVDVDLTVCETGYEWWKWAEAMTKAGFTYEWVSQWYNYGIPYGPIWKTKELAGSVLDYWRGNAVYDHLSPIENSVEVLRQLHERGFDIVFVSTIKGNHHKSKYHFLKRHFPFMKGFVATKEKWLVKADVIIDDRNSVLNSFDDSVIKIRRNTPFDQNESLTSDLDFEFTDWIKFQEWAEENL